MKETMLGKDPIHKLFLTYSIPTVAAMLFLGLNTIVDGLFVGNYIGASALASVNIAMPFSSFVIALSIMIGIGSQSLIGRQLGAGQIKEAHTAFKTAILLIGGSSLLFAAVAAIFPEEIARCLGANEHILEQTAVYIRYSGLFLPFLSVMLVLDYSLKTIGRPIYAMIALILAVSSHMGLTWLLVGRLAMGLKGAALAMGISCMIAFILAMLPFSSKKNTLNFFQGSFDKKTAAHILYCGSAEGLTEIGTGVTTFLFNITLMRYVGETGVAAFTVISYLSFIGNNVLIGLSDGVGAIISYNYGYKKAARVKKALKLACITAFSIGIGFFLVFFVFSKEIVSIFLAAGNEKVLNFALYGAKIYAFSFLVNGLNIVTSGYFTAIGQPKNAALISLSKGFLWITAGIAILPALFGIKGIWLTVPLAEAATILLSIGLLYRHFTDPFRLK